MIEAVIFGERVRLRRIERGDLPRFVEWLNDPEVLAAEAKQHSSFAAFKISGPRNGFLALFASHPPIEERIARLEQAPG